jgi:hypothetical protein
MAEHWANLRLSISYIPARGTRRGHVDWRLSAKPPNRTWDERFTVAFGSELVDGVGWPPSREDMLAMMTEVLMGIRWESADDSPPF